MTDILSDTKVLVLYSGDKSSISTAITMLNRYYSVELLAVNCGTLPAEGHLLHGVLQLQEIYGKARVSYAGVINASAVVNRLAAWWDDTPVSKLATNYPHLKPAQMRCFHCQAAMCCVAIAFAIAKDIPFFAAGYRHTNNVCTGAEFFTQQITDVAKAYDKSFTTPIANCSDDSLNSLMTDVGIHPSVLGPRCLLEPSSTELSPEELTEMSAYFVNHLEPRFYSLVPELQTIYTHTRRGVHSLHGWSKEEAFKGVADNG